MKTVPTCVLAAWVALGLSPVTSAQTAECPAGSPPTSNPPGSVVRVRVLWVDPNSDMESDDDFVPFYDNHADIYGTVTIDGQEFKLPEITDSDFPHWNDVFEKQVASSPVAIGIRIREADSGVTFDDDVVDVNPDPAENTLQLEYDLCAQVVRLGNNQFSTQSPVPFDGGTGSSQAKILLKIETADGRPVSSNDLALVEVDLVQVIHQSPKLIQGKPTVVLMRIANNYSTEITTNVRVAISGGGQGRDDVFPVTIGAGEVKKEYLYLNAPFRFPRSQFSYPATVAVTLDDVNNQNLPPSDCRRRNDVYINRGLWKVVHTPIRYSLMWTRVGTTLDGFNFVPEEQLRANMQLGTSYIHGVYPLSFPYSYPAAVDVLPPLTGAVDFLTSVLSGFGIPLPDNVVPYALVFELNGVAYLTGCDRLMGVLPNKDWFRRFSSDQLDGVTGLSLGEFAPRAVIFLPQIEGDSSLGPAMTLPAHELGHTFGLSTDPTLKDSWVCAVDWPILGHSACGIVGGFDEYKSDTFPDGNPSAGYWIAQGNEAPALVGLLGQPQCESHCFMGGSPPNAHLNWQALHRWIDPADYDHLIAKLQTAPDPEVIYVSGIISWDDRLHLGSIQHKGSGVPDRDEMYGAYALRFFDKAGRVLKEIGIPVYWSSPDFHARPRPVTFFGLNVPFPDGSRQLQIVNRMSAKVLGTVKISRRKPFIKLKDLSKPAVAQNGRIRLKWSARDPDGDRMQYFTMARAEDGEDWFPVEWWQGKASTTILAKRFQPGSYRIKVLASDGIHVSESNEIAVRVTY